MGGYRKATFTLFSLYFIFLYDQIVMLGQELFVYNVPVVCLNIPREVFSSRYTTPDRGMYLRRRRILGEGGAGNPGTYRSIWLD